MFHFSSRLDIKQFNSGKWPNKTVSSKVHYHACIDFKVYIRTVSMRPMAFPANCHDKCLVTLFSSADQATGFHVRDFWHSNSKIQLQVNPSLFFIIFAKTLKSPVNKY